jgi:putative transposase
MELPSRRNLPHDVPSWVDSEKSIYFVTINCELRGPNQLAKESIALPLLESVRFRNEHYTWFAQLFMIMPDHVHGLIAFPPSSHTVQDRMTLWKRWTARQLGIVWQRDFFEHRLRSNESKREKADYILMNPVRRGLVDEPQKWPFILVGR